MRIALENLRHAVLDGFDRMFVVFDDHDHLCCDSAGEGCVGHQHDRRCIDNDQVVFALELFDNLCVMLGTEKFRRVGGNVAAGDDEQVFNFGRVDDLFGLGRAKQNL